MIAFSSFNVTNMFPGMFVDCCMLKSREWGLMAAVGPRQPSVLSGRASFGYSTLASEEKASEK